MSTMKLPGYYYNYNRHKCFYYHPKYWHHSHWFEIYKIRNFPNLTYLKFCMNRQILQQRVLYLKTDLDVRKLMLPLFSETDKFFFF